MHRNLRPLLLAALAVAILSPSAFAQEAEAPKANEKSLWQLYLDGGVLMHPIALCSVAVVAIAGYLALQISRGKMMPGTLVESLNQRMAIRDVNGAFEICHSNPCALTNTVAAALVKVNFERDLYNKASMEAAAGDALAHEETRYMLWINYLNVFATIAPMLGLLGTVQGMIVSFNDLAAGKTQAEDLANGIGVAMITTFGGLVVGIPAMFAYFFFRNNLLANIAEIQRAVTQMLDLFTGEVMLTESGKATAASQAYVSN
jgi:biopolymer transport protein ExbB